VEGIMGSIPLAPSPCNPISLEITLDDLREVVLATEWKFFHLSRKNLDYLHLKEFLKYSNVDCT